MEEKNPREVIHVSEIGGMILQINNFLYVFWGFDFSLTKRVLFISILYQWHSYNSDNLHLI